MDRVLLEKLCNNLNNRGGIIPAASIPEMFALLEELFTPEEAEIAATMPLAAASMQEIAEILDRRPEAIRPFLESMANKGLVATRVQNSVTLYKLLGLMPGIFEFQFMRGGETDRDRRLAKLFRAFLEAVENQQQGGLLIPQDLTPAVRVIPVEETIVRADFPIYRFCGRYRSGTLLLPPRSVPLGRSDL